MKVTWMPLAHGQYGAPEGVFAQGFPRLEDAVAHGRALLKEAVAAQRALFAMGVTA